MNGELKNAALEVSKLIAKFGENSIVENPNRFFGLVTDTLYETKYTAAKNLIKKGLDSGTYATVMSKKGDRFAEAKRATMTLVNTEFMAESHAREIMAMLLISLDSSKTNIDKVEKWVDELSKPQTTTTVSNNNSTTNTTTATTTTTTGDPILTRAFLFLEDSKWMSAEQYAEKAIDKDPSCSKAYLAKLMAELKVSKEANLEKASTPLFADYDNYKKAVRFANGAEKTMLEDYANKNVYAHATKKHNAAKTEQDYKEAARIYNLAPSYKDCASKYELCMHEAESTRKETIYVQALNATATQQVNLFNSISGYKDSDYRREQAKAEVERQKEADRLAKQREEEERRRERERYLERQRKEKSAKVWATVICIAASLGAILVDMLLTDNLKELAGAWSWIWLPLIGAVICGGITTLLCLMTINGKIPGWPLLLFGIPGCLWALVRAGVVALVFLGSAQGFWGVVGAILGLIPVFLLNIAGWAIGCIVCFCVFADECL